MTDALESETMRTDVEPDEGPENEREPESLADAGEKFAQGLARAARRSPAEAQRFIQTVIERLSIEEYAALWDSLTEEQWDAVLEQMPPESRQRLFAMAAQADEDGSVTPDAAERSAPAPRKPKKSKKRKR